MNLVLLIGAVWLAVAVFVGVLIGRGIRFADRKAAEAVAGEAVSPNFVVDLEPPAAVEPAAPTVTTTPEVAAEAEATPASVTPDRARHSIPTARPSAVRNPIRASERSPSSHESGLS